MKQLNRQNQHLIKIDDLKQIDKESIQIYQASISEKRFRDYNNFEDTDNLIDELFQWKLYFGMIDESLPQEYQIWSLFIKSNFPDLNIYDLKLAKNLIASNKLDCGIKLKDISFHKFSNLFIGNILSAYISYRKDSIHKVKNKLQRKIDLQTIEISPEEKLKSFKQYFVFLSKQKSEKKFINDTQGILFEFLIKNNLLEINSDLDLEAKFYSRKHAKSEIIKSSKNLKEKINNLKIKSIDPNKLNNHYIDYIINNWFEKKYFNPKINYKLIENYKKVAYKIDKFLDSIKIEML